MATNSKKNAHGKVKKEPGYIAKVNALAAPTPQRKAGGQQRGR